MKDGLPKIELLFLPGCAAEEATSVMVKKVLGKMGLEGEVSTVVVDTDRKATEIEFTGSPSIRINGRDIEPGADERQDYGLQ